MMTSNENECPSYISFMFVRMGNAISHANRVALYGVQIEQEGIWPTEQLLLIAREASL